MNELENKGNDYINNYYRTEWLSLNNNLYSSRTLRRDKEAIDENYYIINSGDYDYNRNVEQGLLGKIRNAICHKNNSKVYGYNDYKLLPNGSIVIEGKLYDKDGDLSLYDMGEEITNVVTKENIMIFYTHNEINSYSYLFINNKPIIKYDLYKKQIRGNYLFMCISANNKTSSIIFDTKGNLIHNDIIFDRCFGFGNNFCTLQNGLDEAMVLFDINNGNYIKDIIQVSANTEYIHCVTNENIYKILDFNLHTVKENKYIGYNKLTLCDYRAISDYDKLFNLEKAAYNREGSDMDRIAINLFSNKHLSTINSLSKILILKSENDYLVFYALELVAKGKDCKIKGENIYISDNDFEDSIKITAKGVIK